MAQEGSQMGGHCRLQHYAGHRLVVSTIFKEESDGYSPSMWTRSRNRAVAALYFLGHIATMMVKVAKERGKRQLPTTIAARHHLPSKLANLDISELTIHLKYKGRYWRF